MQIYLLTISVETKVKVNPNINNKKVIFNNCAPFTECISKINNTQIYNAKDIDIVMSIYSLTKYSNNSSRTSGSLWQYYRDEPFFDANDAIADFPASLNKK